MDARRWAIIEPLYYAAHAKEPGERSSYLARVCSEDQTLRREIESLLAYADVQWSSPGQRSDMAKLMAEAAGILSVGALSSSQTMKGGVLGKVFPQCGGWFETEISAVLPAAIGGYRIVRILGEGGMGTVYQAEQEQPRRTVALKVIKPGLVAQELLRRFELESQALARLQHPGIAQVYEAGNGDNGSWFAMEFIKGESLLQHVEGHHLKTRLRLELMAKICEAVDHAHRRGIIHRDLKPANILVDETGQPKILDFGVARLTDMDAQTTSQTGLGQLVGTLAYMSPEQVLADPLELDLRSDVYALGVILYELLAGRLPYTLSRKPHEAAQTIREEDPPPLSSVSRVYRGDIETIVAKALEKDKARRYSSAADLAADIQHYLRNEPITARSPSASYRLLKFTRRHQALVTGVAAVFVVLAIGIVVSTWEAVRANRAEQAARSEAAAANAVNAFLQNDLLAQAGARAQARPDRKPDPDLKVRTALDRAAAQIAGKFDGQPSVEASIRETIAITYEDLGLYPEAERQIELALDLRRRLLGEEHPDTLASMNELAGIYRDQGKYEQAETRFIHVLQVRRRVMGTDHLDTLRTMNDLAVLYQDQGKYAQAEALSTKVLDLRRRLLGGQHPDTLVSINSLAQILTNEGRYAQAEPLFAGALEMRRRVLGEEHPDTLISLNNLAQVYRLQGKYAQSEALYTKVLDVKRRVLGEEHPSTLISMNNLGTLYGYQGKYTQAEPLFTTVLEVRRRLLGDKHLDTLISMNNLAKLYEHQGKYAQAEPLFTRVLEMRRRLLEPEHPDILISMNNLAELFMEKGKYAQAEEWFTKVLEIRRRVLGDKHPHTLDTMRDLATLYRNQGKYEQAERILTVLLAAQQSVLGERHPDTLRTKEDLSQLYVRYGKR